MDFQNITWIQWYEYTGTFGGTLWVWVVNILIYKLILKYQLQKSLKRVRTEGIIILSVIILPILISLTQYYSYKIEGKQMNVIALQPNIDPYSEKYNVANEDIAELLLKLTDTKINTQIDVVVAPETVFADHVKINQLDDAYFKRKLDLYITEHPNINILTGISFVNFITDESQVKAQSNFNENGYL